MAGEAELKEKPPRSMFKEHHGVIRASLRMHIQLPKYLNSLTVPDCQTLVLHQMQCGNPWTTATRLKCTLGNRKQEKKRNTTLYLAGEADCVAIAFSAFHTSPSPDSYISRLVRATCRKVHEWEEVEKVTLIIFVLTGAF